MGSCSWQLTKISIDGLGREMIKEFIAKAIFNESCTHVAEVPSL